MPVGYFPFVGVVALELAVVVAFGVFAVESALGILEAEHSSPVVEHSSRVAVDSSSIVMVGQMRNSAMAPVWMS